MTNNDIACEGEPEPPKTDEEIAELRLKYLVRFNARTPSLQPVGDADFEERVLGAEGVAVVQFYARWCGPCHDAGKALELVAASGRQVFKLDCEEAVETAKRFCVRSYPKIFMFRRGALKDLYTGERTPEALEAWIRRRAGPLPGTEAADA
jgi:thioredoxin-like negative regulator of GroEL